MHPSTTKSRKKTDQFTMPLGFLHELVVDNFAGGGGASEGIEQALGRPVDIAINHDGEALLMHAANHPGTRHFREDVFDIHPGFITAQQPIGYAWFSPDCKHHSIAKGGKPREQKIRGLAWVTLKWAAFQIPRSLYLENVTEFADWGPLDDAGKPIKSERGRTFRAFIAALSTGLAADHPDCAEIYDTLGADFPMHRLQQGLGYDVEHKVLRACDAGAPTIRKRLYMVARRDGLPIRWPTPTHGDPKSERVRSGELAPWRTAAECIDWSLPCPSIFDRKRPLADATLRRIAKGIMKFVVDNPNPFIVGAGGPVYSGKPKSIHEPFNTVVVENHSQLVMPVLERIGQAGSGGNHSSDAGEDHLSASTMIQIGYGERKGQSPRVPGLDKPLGTIVAGGGKHALVSACLAKHYGGVTGTRIDVPAGTVTTTDHHSLVTAQLEPVELSVHGHKIDVPLDADERHGPAGPKVRAFLIKYYGDGGQHQDLRAPMHTIPTKDRLGLVTIHGEDYAIVDIGMRMLTPRELARAQGFPDTYILDPMTDGKPLSKKAQVRMIGNSVCPPMARAIIEANSYHEREMMQAA